MKPCTDRKEAIAMLAAGALTPSKAAAVRSHFLECAGCSSYASQLGLICSRLGEPLARSASVEPRPGFHARLKHRIQSERPAASRASIFEALRDLFTLQRIVSASALVALVVGLAFWVHSDKGALDHPVVQTVQSSPSNANGKQTNVLNASTLMAYQAAFNRSFEDFDTLITQNAARTSTDDGMTLIRSGDASF